MRWSLLPFRSAELRCSAFGWLSNGGVPVWPNGLAGRLSPEERKRFAQVRHTTTDCTCNGCFQSNTGCTPHNRTWNSQHLLCSGIAHKKIEATSMQETGRRYLAASSAASSAVTLRMARRWARRPSLASFRAAARSASLA